MGIQPTFHLVTVRWNVKIDYFNGADETSFSHAKNKYRSASEKVMNKLLRHIGNEWKVSLSLKFYRRFCCFNFQVMNNVFSHSLK